MIDLELTTPPPPPAPPSKFSDPAYLFVGADGLRAGWGILIFVVLCFAFGGILSVVIARLRHIPLQPQASGAHLMPVAGTLLSEGALFLAALFTTFLMSKIERRPIARFGFGGTHRLSHLFQGFFWGVACLSLLIAMLVFSGHLQFDGRLLTTPAALRYGLLWFLGFILVAGFEETFMRGYLQSTIARGVAGLFPDRYRGAISFWIAAVILSALFGASHGSNPGESPFGLVAAGLAGLLFCLALYRTGSLWWAIGFHATWDWAQSFLYGVADSGTMVQGHLYATHPVGSPLLSGGTTGPEGSIYLIPTLAVAAAAIFFTLPKTEERPARAAVTS
jgi:membrane protease YdiL (CAAX protease family)